MEVCRGRSYRSHDKRCGHMTTCGAFRICSEELKVSVLELRVVRGLELGSGVIAEGQGLDARGDFG